MSKTSANGDKMDSEIDNVYLEDTIPNHALNEEAITQEIAADIPYLQSSSDDIKHILGIPTEDMALQKDAEECVKSDTLDKEKETDEGVTISADVNCETDDTNLGQEKGEDILVKQDVSSQSEKAIELPNSDNIKDEASLPNNEIDITSEEINDDTFQKLIKSAPGSPEKHTSSNDSNLLSDSLVESEVAMILKDAVDKALTKKDSENKSRPVSSCSGKISHDDRIVPGGVSRPHSPLQGDDVESEGKVKSRPASACSGKISHDERIVPGVLSRPESPILSEDTDGQET